MWLYLLLFRKQLWVLWFSILLSGPLLSLPPVATLMLPVALLVLLMNSMCLEHLSDTRAKKRKRLPCVCRENIW